MIVPDVIKYLKDHSFAQLESEHGVCARPDSRGMLRPKFSLNYDMIMSKPGVKLVEQCRGLIIRPVGDFDVSDPTWIDRIVGDVSIVAWPMNRFYNYGDVNASQIDWNTATIHEKLDGTMCILYWDPEYCSWCVGTRSVPDADLPITNGIMQHDMTFSDLFMQSLIETWKQHMRASSHPFVEDVVNSVVLSDLLDCFNRTMTYVFELTSPYNRVVVKYNDQRVTLLAMRHTESGIEKDPASRLPAFIPLAKTWKFKSFNDITDFVNCADPADLEGAVVIDHTFARVKVKNKAWVLSSRAKDLLTVSRRSAVEAIFAGQIDDIIPLLEGDIAAKLMDMQDTIRTWLKNIDKNYELWVEQSGGVRRTFAEIVLTSGDTPAPYFSLWDKRAENACAWAKHAIQTGKLSHRFIDGILNKYDNGNLTKNIL